MSRQLLFDSPPFGIAMRCPGAAASRKRALQRAHAGGAAGQPPGAHRAGEVARDDAGSGTQLIVPAAHHAGRLGYAGWAGAGQAVQLHHGAVSGVVDRCRVRDRSEGRNGNPQQSGLLSTCAPPLRFGGVATLNSPPIFAAPNEKGCRPC